MRATDDADNPYFEASHLPRPALVNPNAGREYLGLVMDMEFLSMALWGIGL